MHMRYVPRFHDFCVQELTQGMMHAQIREAQLNFDVFCCFLDDEGREDSDTTNSGP